MVGGWWWLGVCVVSCKVCGTFVWGTRTDLIVVQERPYWPDSDSLLGVCNVYIRQVIFLVGQRTSRRVLRAFSSLHLPSQTDQLSSGVFCCLFCLPSFNIFMIFRQRVPTPCIKRSQFFGWLTGRVLYFIQMKSQVVPVKNSLSLSFLIYKSYSFFHISDTTRGDYGEVLLYTTGSTVVHRRSRVGKSPEMHNVSPWSGVQYGSTRYRLPTIYNLVFSLL